MALGTASIQDLSTVLQEPVVKMLSDPRGRVHDKPSDAQLLSLWHPSRSLGSECTNWEKYAVGETRAVNTFGCSSLQLRKY